MSDVFRVLPSTTVDPIMVANASWPTFAAKHADAVNTTIGIMIDADSHKPWQPKTVSAARDEALTQITRERAFGYQTQTGYADFLKRAAGFVFGEKLYAEIKEDVLSYETLGGTGALHLTKETLLELLNTTSDGTIPLFLDPGWPNHPAIFSHPFAIRSYEHLTADGRYNHLSAKQALTSSNPSVAAGIFQAGGYNDDGADRTIDQWQDIATISADNGMVAVIDAAYLGLCDGLNADRLPIEVFIRKGVLTFICASFSKNMGLYNERLGVLFVVNAGRNKAFNQRDNLHQCIMRIVRRTISSAPRLSAQAAAIVLADPVYLEELEDARQKLHANRQLFAAEIQNLNLNVKAGRGMFTKVYPNGFTAEQVQHLADKGILALQNSRINLGGMDSEQVRRVGQAIRASA